MKTRIFLFLLFCVSMTAFSQETNVRLPQRPDKPSFKNYSNENVGFWCAAEAEGASSVMATQKNMQFVSATFTGGYRFSQYLKLGLGLGFRGYVNNTDVLLKKNKWDMPIFFNVRGNFISAYHRGGAPFWSVNTGGITKEGFYFSPTLGYSIGGMRNNFTIGVSYSINNFECYRGNTIAYSYFGLKLGYEY